MTKTITISLAILLLGALPAAADFEVIDLAHEVPFQNLGLPTSAHGTLTFRECSQCKVITLRATPSTTYTVNGEAFALRAFGVELQRLRSKAIAAQSAATVLHNLETGTVLSITVHL